MLELSYTWFVFWIGHFTNMCPTSVVRIRLICGTCHLKWSVWNS